MADKFTREFERFVSQENLHLAWKRLTHSVRRDVKDWLGLQAYAPQLDTHIEILQDSLRIKYAPSNAYTFFKTKQDRSLRRFSFLTMDDQFVYQALNSVLIHNSHGDITALAHRRRLFANIPTPPEDRSPFAFKRVFGHRFSESEGQYDRFRGQVLRSRKQFLQAHETPWLVRTDIRSYYPSIEHRRLDELLSGREWLADKQTRSVLMDCLDTWAIEKGRGSPIG